MGGWIVSEWARAPFAFAGMKVSTLVSASVGACTVIAALLTTETGTSPTHSPPLCLDVSDGGRATVSERNVWAESTIGLLCAVCSC
jgi:hypothetical protein